MNLHRTTSRPDWAGINPSARNGWQRLASRSGGIVTPGNTFSLVGLMLVGLGVGRLFADDVFIGIVVVALGRGCDMVDGYVAHATGTKSPLGEGIDAACDKAAIFIALVAFGLTGLVWWPVLVAVAMQNVANSLIGIIAARRHSPLHPSAVGKLATAWQWTSLITAVVGHGAAGFLWVAYACILVGIGLGVVASWKYARALQRFVLKANEPAAITGDEVYQ